MDHRWLEYSAQALWITTAVLVLFFPSCSAFDTKMSFDSKDASDSSAFGDPGKFDSYVLAMSWTPEFCTRQPTTQECQLIKPSEFAAQNFGLHGLWPQYNQSHQGHDWPQDNSTYWNAISTVQENVKQEFHQLWSKYAPAYLTDLVEHEWQRHGSCALPAILQAWQSKAALSEVQSSYFADQMTLMKAYPTPSIVTQAMKTGQPVAVSELQAHYGGSQFVGLQCDIVNGKPYLSQVELCFGKTVNGHPTAQVACPSTVLEDDYDNNCVTTHQTQVYVAQLYQIFH